ncbi:MAG: AI-2E family transporter [Candidatus Kerfeldbacteria bacterium]|nr:AI-2E family transporter [Candidatus Kerfeldbacteria bacterium]
MQIKIPKKISPFTPKSSHEGEVVHYINVSSMTVLKVFGVMAGVFFLWSIRDVLGILFIAIVLASALDPWVDRLERYRIPRGVSILSMFFLFFFMFAFVFYLILPPIVEQMSDIASSLHAYMPQIEHFYQYVTQSNDASLIQEWQRNLSNVNSTLSNVTSSLFNTISSIFGKVATIIFVLVITFYMTIEEDGLKKFVRSIAPIQFQPYLVQKTNRIQTKMGAWLRGQLILMLIIGVFAFIGLFAVQVPYALVLACIAGLAEFIPFLGPLISAVPAVFFAYTDSPWKAIAVMIIYIVLQQIENHIIAPQVMKKAVGLNPIVVISVMLIGAKLAGIAGILLAVPATTIAWIFLEDIFEQKKEMDNTLEQPIDPVTKTDTL